MNYQTVESIPGKENIFASPHALRDIFIVATPIVLLGIAGNMIGLSTLMGGAVINFGYLLVIIFGGLILKQQGSSWREIGLGIPANRLKTALAGIGALIGAVIFFMGTQIIVFGILNALGLISTELDQSRFNSLEGNLPLFILMVILAWTTIAFGEELFYRAFLITRMVDHTPIRKGLAILISGTVFGLIHFAEGPIGILSNGAFGILFGWIYVRSGRNLWITVIGHGLINTIRFALLYYGMV